MSTSGEKLNKIEKLKNSLIQFNKYFIEKQKSKIK